MWPSIIMQIFFGGNTLALIAVCVYTAHTSMSPAHNSSMGPIRISIEVQLKTTQMPRRFN